MRDRENCPGNKPPAARPAAFFLWALVTLTALPCFAHAASFDCTKAAGIAEQRICSDEELSRLDQEPSAAYIGARSLLDPAAVKCLCFWAANTRLLCNRQVSQS
jgi:hypothetical protein